MYSTTFLAVFIPLPSIAIPLPHVQRRDNRRSVTRLIGRGAILSADNQIDASAKGAFHFGDELADLRAIGGISAYGKYLGGSVTAQNAGEVGHVAAGDGDAVTALH